MFQHGNSSDDHQLLRTPCNHAGQPRREIEHARDGIFQQGNEAEYLVFYE